jgi:TorA maturation chaperone TorD
MTTESIVGVDPLAAARPNVYFGLAAAFGPPESWDRELSELLARATADLPDPLPGLGADLAAHMERLLDDRGAAVLDYARLFFGPFEILAAPWASFYLEDEPRLMGPSSAYAAHAYAEAGLTPKGDSREAPDHVTRELEFMYFLAFEEARTGDAVWTSRRTRFWREHLGRWLPEFADAIGKVDVDPFWATLAETIQEVCALEG